MSVDKLSGTSITLKSISRISGDVVEALASVHITTVTHILCVRDLSQLEAKTNLPLSVRSP